MSHKVKNVAVSGGGSVTWQCTAALGMVPGFSSPQVLPLREAQTCSAPILKRCLAAERWETSPGQAMGSHSDGPVLPVGVDAVGCRKGIRVLHRIRGFVHKQTPSYQELAQCESNVLLLLNIWLEEVVSVHLLKPVSADLVT